jgi:hypothetical protein
VSRCYEHGTALQIAVREVCEGRCALVIIAVGARSSQQRIRASCTHPCKQPQIIRSTRIGETCKACLRQHSIMRLAHTSRIGHDDDAMPPGHSQNLPSAFVCVGRQFRLRSKADSAVRLKEDAILLSDICLQHLWLHWHSHGVVGRCAHVVFNLFHPCMLQCKWSTAIAIASGNHEVTNLLLLQGIPLQFAF